VLRPPEGEKQMNAYDIATLNDIAKRIQKGWVIRRDEIEMLLRMAYAEAEKEAANTNTKPATTVVTAAGGYPYGYPRAGVTP
jgi:hypothetical protein